MTHSVNIKAITSSSSTEDTLFKAFRDKGLFSLEVVFGPLSGGLERIKTDASEMIIIDLDLDQNDQVKALESYMKHKSDDTTAVVTSPTISVQMMRRLMNMKVADYVPQPFGPEEILSVVQRTLMEKKSEGSADRESAKVIAFVKPAGGLGCTTLAVQSAFTMARQSAKNEHKSVCLVDLDFVFGNAATFLDLEPGLEIRQLSQSPERLDAALLHSMVSRHSSGWDLLAAPVELMEAETIQPEVILKILEVVCQEYDYVLVDMPQYWTQWSPAVLAGSDVIVMVLQMDVPSVKCGKEFYDALMNRSAIGGEFIIVANRYDKPLLGGGFPVKVAEKVLGRPINYFVGSDYNLVSEAHNKGVSITEVQSRSKIEKQIKELVGSFVKERE